MGEKPNGLTVGRWPQDAVGRRAFRVTRSGSRSYANGCSGDRGDKASYRGPSRAGAVGSCTGVAAVTSAGSRWRSRVDKAADMSVILWRPRQTPMGLGFTGWILAAWHAGGRPSGTWDVWPGGPWTTAADAVIVDAAGLNRCDRADLPRRFAQGQAVELDGGSAGVGRRPEQAEE